MSARQCPSRVVALWGAGGDAAGAIVVAAGPDPSADRSADADGPSRYPVARAPRADCQLRIAARVRGPNRPSAPPGSKTAACSPCWIRRRAARSRFSPSSTTGPLQPQARTTHPEPPPRERHSANAACRASAAEKVRRPPASWSRCTTSTRRSAQLEVKPGCQHILDDRID